MKDGVDIFVFDIETIPDIQLLRDFKYPGSTMRGEDLYTTWQEEQRELGESTFLPIPWHSPVAIGLCKAGPDLSLRQVLAVHDLEGGPEGVARKFWRGWEKYGGPTLVTYNGRGFDMPVLETYAFRYGIEEARHWFSQEGPNYKHPRYRFNTDAHFDCQEFISNFGGQRIPGGLDMFAYFAGGAGKSMGIDGSQVFQMWQDGKQQQIFNYAMCDALDTYLLFLRCEVLRGRITPMRERDLRVHARGQVSRMENPFLAEYLSKATFGKGDE